MNTVKLSPEDQIWLKGCGIKPEPLPLVAEDPAPAPAPGRMPPRPAGTKLPLNPPKVLQYIRKAPKSVTLNELAEAFGEDIPFLLSEMVQGHLVRAWGTKAQPNFYIDPDSRDMVDAILKKSGLD